MLKATCERTHFPVEALRIKALHCTSLLNFVIQCLFVTMLLHYLIICIFGICFLPNVLDVVQ